MLDAYKTFRISLQHVSAHYVPSAGSVVKFQNRKPVAYTVVVVRIVCFAVAYKINLFCDYGNKALSAVHKI